jgi:hypothetical protein
MHMAGHAQFVELNWQPLNCEVTRRVKRERVRKRVENFIAGISLCVKVIVPGF